MERIGPYPAAVKKSPVIFPNSKDSKLVKLLARRDFMFSSSDLRGWSLKNDSALLVPGITHVHNIPAPEKLRKNKAHHYRYGNDLDQSGGYG